MKIYLQSQNPQHRQNLEQILELYNLPHEICPLTENHEHINYQKHICLSDEKETRKTLTQKPWKHYLRLDVDLHLPADAPLIYELLNQQNQPKHPLVILSNARGQSGCTYLATYPYQLKNGAIIRINLLEDPTFTQRLSTEYTLIPWPKQPQKINLMPELLPDGEIVFDADWFTSAPSENNEIVNLLTQLRARAPVLVDAGRISKNLITIAQRTHATLLLADTRRKWGRRKPAATTQTLAKKWHVTIAKTPAEILEQLTPETAAKND